MDPLSVSASIVGLLGAGAQISSFLLKAFGDARDAPKLAQSLIWEMADIAAALGSLQSYVSGRARAPVERSALILLEQVLTTLTGCVTTYSDLQRIVDELNAGPDMGKFDKLKWSRQNTKINVIVQRLQNHKSSLTLMLTILQCQSMQEAESSTRKLCALVEEVLRSDRDLADRINGLEREGSVYAETRAGRDDISTFRQSIGPRPPSFIGTGTPTSQFSFDQELQASRVYNRSINRFSMSSTTSTALYTTALSVFSKLSLSQVSNLSFFALPVYAADISNSAHYVFGEEGALRNSQNSKGESSWDAKTASDGRSRDRDKPKNSNDSQSKLPIRTTSGLLGRFARRRKAPVITGPENPVHVTHVGYNPHNGEFVGLPKEWQRLIAKGAERRPAIEETGDAAKDPKEEFLDLLKVERRDPHDLEWLYGLREPRPVRQPPSQDPSAGKSGTERMP